MRKKGEPRDPMHTRKRTKHSDICRDKSRAERSFNQNEDPPNRRGRSARRAAERKAHVKKAATLAAKDIDDEQMRTAVKRIAARAAE